MVRGLGVGGATVTSPVKVRVVELPRVLRLLNVVSAWVVQNVEEVCMLDPIGPPEDPRVLQKIVMLDLAELLNFIELLDGE